MGHRLRLHGGAGRVCHARRHIFAAAGPAGTVIALAVGTLLMLVVGMNFSFLMTNSPNTGGVYSYTKNAFGRDHAFLAS
ncbi:MAG: APC family permease [Clostridia bacterium]|nr:APC family permease [Clostridia bacterium]